MIRLLRSLWKVAVSGFGFVAHTFVDFFTWLRRPCSKLKAVTAVLAVGCLIAGLNSYTNGIKVAELKNRIVFIVDEHEFRVAELEGHIGERDARLDSIAETLRREMARIKEMEAATEAARAEMRNKALAAEEEARLWEERYNRRPESCRAAVEYLDTACADLEGY